MYKNIKFLWVLLLSVYLIFTPVYAYATTSVGGWTATDSLIAGANTTINAAKTAGGKALKSSITVAASASKVGKYLIKGGGNAAIAYAMVELADGAIDWVLDPANNRVKYTVAGDTVDTPTNKCYRPSGLGYYFNTPTEACQYFVASHAGAGSVFVSSSSSVCKYMYGETLKQKGIEYICSGTAPPPTVGSPVEKYIPIDTVAAKVISNAAAGHAPSQEAVKATALEGFAAGEHDAALDAAAVPDTGVENPPDTENPPKDPAEPFDPSGIISAINALKALLAGILSSVTSIADFFGDTEVPPVTPDDTEVAIQTPEMKDPSMFDKSYISVTDTCPPDINASIPVGPTSFSLVIPITPICSFGSTYVSPILKFLAYIFVALGISRSLSVG